MDVKVKPWWQSTSLWVTVATIIMVIYESQLIPADSIGYKILSIVVAAFVALGLVAKRGYVEAAAIKANTLAAIANKQDPTKPQQP